MRIAGTPLFFRSLLALRSEADGEIIKEPVKLQPEAGRGDAAHGLIFREQRYGKVHKQKHLSDSLGVTDADREQRPPEGSRGPPTETMPSRSKNLFLSSLSPASRQMLVSRSKPVVLRAKMRLFRPEHRPTYAYFVTSGIASIVSEMSDGSTAEVGMIGRDGVVGALHLLGPLPSPTYCFAQMESTALRIRLTDLAATFQESAEIRVAVLKLVQKDAMVLSQVAGCNRLHSAEERLARWLLIAQDYVQSDDLKFTQALLANMLGARRATVTEIAGSLQRAGLIKYHRGQVTILDRNRLEKSTCDCYRVIKELRGDLYNMA